MAKKIGLIGGTGPEGKGLAARFALAGLEVFLGSRSADKGEEAAKEVASLTRKKARGGTNAEAVRQSELLVLTVPYGGLRPICLELASLAVDKVVVSTVVPLAFSRMRIEALAVPDGSAAEEAQLLLPLAQVTAAFHNLSASHLLDLQHDIDGDVLVCSDHIDAMRETMELAELIKGVRAINAGPLANSHYIEEMTALLLNINRINRATTHVRITGL